MRARVSQWILAGAATVALAACDAPVSEEQSGNGEGTIELSEFPDRP